MASGGKDVGDYHEAPEGSPSYLIEAFADVGIVEYVTRNRKREPNPVVVAWATKSIGYKVNTITTPWCAIYIGAKLEDAGYTCTKSAMARSYLNWGTKIDHGDEDKWAPGDIAVIWRGRKNDGVTGHVFFILDWDDTYVYGLGGNQGDSVCVQRFLRTKLLGIRRPRTVMASKTVKSGAVAVISKAGELAAQKAIPEPEQVEQIINTAKGPLQLMGAAKPWIVGLLAALSIAATLYAIWYRMQDFNSGKNA